MSGPYPSKRTRVASPDEPMSQSPGYGSYGGSYGSYGSYGSSGYSGYSGYGSSGGSYASSGGGGYGGSSGYGSYSSGYGSPTGAGLGPSPSSSYGYSSPTSSSYGSGTNRTIYLGNVDAETTYRELIDKLRGGLLESVRILPEKKCAFVRFVDPAAALSFTQMAGGQLMVRNRYLKVGWGKAQPLRPEIASAVARGATRNVFIGQIDDSVTEDSLRDDFKGYGEIDKVDVLPKKQIAFVHFASIGAAIKAVEALQQSDKYKSRRLAYGRDRSSYDRKGGRDYSTGAYAPDRYASPSVVSGSPMTALPPVYSPPSASGGEFNRTVYIGGLHADTTYSELLDVVRGGPVASCKLLADKNCAFVTFVDPESAANFHRAATYGNRDTLTVHGQKVRVGWGKPSPLQPTVLAALARGATRNVYLGGIDEEVVTESKLTTDLSTYGIVEKVNVVPDKSIAFVNFTNIQSAVKAVAALRQDQYYSKFKINYGKDRCAR